MLSILLFILLFTAFLPYGTDVPCERKPLVTMSIIGVAVAVHFMLLVVMAGSGSVGGLLGEGAVNAPAATDGLRQMIEQLSLSPHRLLKGEIGAMAGIFTSPWFHMHFFHLLINVWVFYIFGANVENLFGRKRFGAMLVAAAVVSALGAVVVSGPGNVDGETLHGLKGWWEAAALVVSALGADMVRGPGIVDGETFRGLEGLMAAAAGAFLVCFPRSHVKIILIVAPLFWVLVFFIIAPIAGVVRLILPLDISQVLGMGLFLAVFAAMQPTRLVFGLPALLFFCINIFLRLPLDGTGGFNLSSAQFGVNAGGFLTGAVAGLLVYGLKGFGEQYSVDDHPRAYVTAAMRRRVEEAKLEEDGSSAALRELLGRRVFTGDAPEAVRMYTEQIYPDYPDLSLEDPHLQLTLARMLAVRQVDLPALRAYELLLAKSGLGEVETTAACLEAAVLCARVPESVDMGRELLARLKDVTLTQRDRTEVERIQDLLAAAEGAADGKVSVAPRPVIAETVESKPEGPPKVAPRVQGRMQALKTLAPLTPVAEERAAASKIPAESGEVPERDLPTRHYESPRAMPELGVYPSKPRGGEAAYGGLPMGDGSNEPWVVILPAGPKDDPADLYACLRELWRDDQRARRAVESARGVAGRNLTRGDSEDLVERLARHGLVGKATVQPAEASTMPDIAVAVEITGAKMRVRVASKWSEFDLADTAWLGLARVKLSPQSRSVRTFADVWFKAGIGRIWLPLDSLGGENCRIDGEACSEADAATQLLGVLQQRIRAEHQASTWRVAQGDMKNAPEFDTMMTYENAVLWDKLMQSGNY